MARFTQDDRLLKVTTPLADDVLLLDHFFGAETVSAPFRFSLRLFSEQDNLQLKDLMGQGVTVEMGTFDGDPRYFHGCVVSFAHAGSDGGFTFYDMQLGPWTDFLRRRKNCRIFQELKVEDILKEVFADYGAAAVHDVRATSKEPLTMCLQYNETDFQFVSRLMESQGWLYHFDHDDGKHTLIVEKDSTALSPMPLQPDIEFNDSPGADAQDAIDRFESFRSLVPNKLALKTFDFKNPRDPLLVKVDTQHQMGQLPTMEWYEHHGPYAYKEFEEGDDLAQLHLEEAEARSKGFRGSGNCRALTCGHTFKLYHHYLYDGEYLVLSVEHHGSNNYFERSTGSPYRNSFTAMRKAVKYRPATTTPRPVMRGPQSATVVGPDGEEIYCDKYGRIKIQFHWDREGQFNDQSSCWVRLAMPWAGSSFGFISIPRIGQEVLVDFLEGDPDLPIVVGSIYNELNYPPWALPANKTQTGILTRSTKGGTSANANALRFEDKKNHEEVWLHAERNQRVEVEVDETHSVGHDRTTTIGHDETKTIKHKQNVTVTESTAELFVDGGSRIVIVKQQYYLLADNIYAEANAQGITQRAATEVRQEIGAGGDKYLKVDSGGHIEGATTTDINFKVGGNHVKIDSGGNIEVTATTAVTITVGASTVTVNASGVHINGAAIDVTATGMVTVTGSMVKLNC